MLRIDAGGLTGKKVKAPVRKEWFGSPTADSASFQPHPDFGFVCPHCEQEFDAPDVRLFASTEVVACPSCHKVLGTGKQLA